MFEANDEITRQVGKLYRACKPLNRGDVLTHETIRGILGIDPHEGRWDHIVGRVRRLMRKNHGIELWPEHTVGYKLLTVDEQLKMVPHQRALRADRHFRRGIRAVEALDDRKLTEHQRKVKVAQLDSLRIGGRIARSKARTMAALSRKTETNPRPERVSA